MTTMPKMIAPKKAPMADPYPPVSKAATDHRGDDRLEFLLEAAPRVGRACVDHGDDRHQRGTAGRQHEQ